MNPGEEIRLETPQGRLAALRWGASDGPPVLCLHGWLDNAASFMPLAQHIEKLNLVALDFPGHGHSYHRHSGARYYFAEYLWDVDAALDALGWNSCHLLGHSLGGAVSCLYAPAAPERVRSLVLLDGLGPLVGGANTTAERLRSAMRDMRRPRTPLKAYESIDRLARARMAVSDLSLEAARLICERSARRVEDHYEWRTDPALNWRSPILLAEEQSQDCLRNIRAPVLSITATPFSRWYSEETVIARQAAVRNGTFRTVNAHHHFHMDIPDQIAGQIESFVLEQDASIQHEK